jgi:hypothetical protein
MARDFENLNDLDDLNDGELRDLVRSHLRDHNGIDPDDITVRIAEGTVVLEGRVGTDAERRIAEHVITDVVGITSVENNLVVDAIRRAESPMDIDDHLAEEERTEGLVLGDRAMPFSPEAEHLEEDEDAQLSGTTDLGKAIGEGTAWIPPESPTQEGYDGTDAPRCRGEDH